MLVLGRVSASGREKGRLLLLELVLVLVLELVLVLVLVLVAWCKV